MKSLTKEEIKSIYQPLFDNIQECNRKYKALKVVRVVPLVIAAFALVQTSEVMLIIALFSYLFLYIYSLLMKNLNTMKYYEFHVTNIVKIPSELRVVVEEVQNSGDELNLVLKKKSGEIHLVRHPNFHVIFIPEKGEVLHFLGKYLYSRFGVPLTDQSANYLASWFKNLGFPILSDAKFRLNGYSSSFFSKRAKIKSIETSALSNSQVLWLKYIDKDDKNGVFEGVIRIQWRSLPGGTSNVKNLSTWAKVFSGKPVEALNKNFVREDCVFNFPFIGNPLSWFPTCHIWVYGYLAGANNLKGLKGLLKWIGCSRHRR